MPEEREVRNLDLSHRVEVFGPHRDAIDPTEWFASAGDLFNSKKKLPGDRKPVFPQGVPGVAQGIPQELVKGNQPTKESGFASSEA